MSRFTALSVVALVVALAAGCDDKKDAPAGADAAATGAATSTNVVALGSAPSIGKVADDPSEADFEEEAEKTINAANLESEIAKMEAELK